jgi:hypothetical protein
VRIDVIWVGGANRRHVGVSRPGMNDSRCHGKAENDAGEDAVRTKVVGHRKLYPQSIQDAHPEPTRWTIHGE